MIPKTTSVLGLSIVKLGYDSNRRSANSKSEINPFWYAIYKAKKLKIVKLKCLNQTFSAVCHHQP